MATLSPAYIEMRYSGGVGNTDPLLSLGGAMSSTRIPAQLITNTVPIPGVTVLHTSGSVVGVDGTLTYDQPANNFTWDPPSSSPGTAVSAPATDGRITLYDSTNEKQIDIDVVLASLPVAGVTNSTVEIANNPNAMFPNITGEDSVNGKVDYHCFYYTNVHPTESTISLRMYIDDASSGIYTERLGTGSAGLNNVEPAVVNELTAPADVIFSALFTLPTSGLVLPNLAPGDFIPVWIRRDIFPSNVSFLLLSLGTIGLQVESTF